MNSLDFHRAFPGIVMLVIGGVCIAGVAAAMTASSRRTSAIEAMVKTGVNPIDARCAVDPDAPYTRMCEERVRLSTTTTQGSSK